MQEKKTNEQRLAELEEQSVILEAAMREMLALLRETSTEVVRLRESGRVNA